LLAGGFVEGDLMFGALGLTGGARLDHWRLSDSYALEVRPDGSLQTDSRFVARSGTISSVRGAAVWTVADGLRLRASAYTGFRLPTLNELYRGFTVFPVATRANAALTPERLRGWEGGIEWTPVQAVRLAFTGFDNRLGDAIANVTIGTNLRQRRNVAAIRARGMEATLHFERNSLSLDAGWAWSHSRVRIDPADSAALPLDGLRPAQSPAHSGALSIAWTSGGWRVQAGVRHVGAQFEDDRNIDVLPAATTVDALVRMPLGRGLTLSLRGENLFNETVVTRNAAGSIDLGTPRTLWLALRWALD
jgi:iron complex outermembrane receptor protein